ncbi:type II toxin-antitoxin system HicA family toxin [Candidatus Parcubacteria bacterium]|nr:type II toxin-antitoxin system HicA family toxin [Candidatus Parcubacteria bacterium]
MTQKLPVIKPKQIVKILKKIGFVERRQTGSHLILSNPDTNKIVPVPMHAKELKKGTLLSILRQADITKEELENYKK